VRCSGNPLVNIFTHQIPIWSHRLPVRTPGFHPGNRGSIPRGTTYRGVEQWSARKAHNLEVGGSNPSSATKIILKMVKIFDTNDISKIIELDRKFPNDQDFGKSVRTLMRFNDFVLEYPNDQELGRELRKIVLSKSKQIN
jgi:hypothetical protein